MKQKREYPIRVMMVTGTRPEIIKVSLLLKIMQKDPELELIFVHTGQHYDENLFKIFLTELNLPLPHFYLEVGSAPNSVQTGKILIDLYEIIKEKVPHIILAQGDTNTVFAAALSAFKNDIPFGHIEAGIRSYDMQMPEEINRMLTGQCSLLNFTPTKLATDNLLNEGILPSRIFQVGNPIVDVVNANFHLAQTKSIIDKTLHISPNEQFILVTIHRPANVDDKEVFTRIISTLCSLKYRIIYPIHPRARKNLENFQLSSLINQLGTFELISPLGYFDFLKLQSLAYIILTDSGGIQEESTILHKPCLTLRENTERPESVEVGGNILVGSNSERILFFIQKLWNDTDFYKKMSNCPNPFGTGTSSDQIVQIIKNHYAAGLLEIPSARYLHEIPTHALLSLSKRDHHLTVKEFEIKYQCIILEIFDSQGKVLYPSPSEHLSAGSKVKVRNFQKIDDSYK